MRLAVAREIGEVHVAVAMGEQGIKNGRENTRLVSAEVVGSNEIERGACFGFVVIVPVWAVVSA